MKLMMDWFPRSSISESKFFFKKGIEYAPIAFLRE